MIKLPMITNQGGIDLTVECVPCGEQAIEVDGTLLTYIFMS